MDIWIDIDRKIWTWKWIYAPKLGKGHSNMKTQSLCPKHSLPAVEL